MTNCKRNLDPFSPEKNNLLELNQSRVERVILGTLHKGFPLLPCPIQSLLSLRRLQSSTILCF